MPQKISMTCNLLLFKQDHLLLLRTEPWINAPGPAPALILPDFFAGLQDFADSVGPLLACSIRATWAHLLGEPCNMWMIFTDLVVRGGRGGVDTEQGLMELLLLRVV